MLHFDPTTGLFADQTETVREQVRAEWKKAFGQDLDVAAETPAGQLIDSQTAAIVAKDTDVLYMASQFNPLTAEGVWQDALAKIYFITRKVAQSSVATCLCAGLPGTVIAQGSVIKSAVDGSLWVSSGAATIGDEGTATVVFDSERHEALMAAPDTLTHIVTVTPGWDTVTNPTPATPGRVAEGRGEFEQRRADSVAKNAHGSLAAIYSTLADIEGVIHCVVLENCTNADMVKWGVTIPGHSIFASIVGGEDGKIAEAIYRKKDAGCGTAGNTDVTFQDTSVPGAPLYVYKIERPRPVTIGVAVAVKIGKSISIAGADTIEGAVKKAVLQNFYGLDGSVPASVASYIFASRFYCPVNDALAGAGQLVAVRIATPADSKIWQEAVTINADMYPTVAEGDIKVYLDDSIPDLGA